jgi:hypothetical protein
METSLSLCEVERSETKQRERESSQLNDNLLNFVITKKQKYEARVPLKRNDKCTHAFGHKQKQFDKFDARKQIWNF